MENINNQLIKNARIGKLRGVIKYLNKGANIHADNDRALRWSCANGHIKVVSELIKRGANIHAYFNNSLVCSSKNGNTEIVTELLKNNANPNYNLMRGFAHDDPLESSFKENHVDVSKILIEYGANVDVIEGGTLCRLIAENNLEMLIMYLQYASINISMLYNLLKFSMDLCRLDIISLLFEKCTDLYDMINGAFLYGVETRADVAVVMLLLKLGADVRAGNDAALEHCVINCQLEMAEILLGHGGSLCDTIFKALENNFDDNIARLIFSYCNESDYDKFPHAFVMDNINPTKNAQNYALKN